jgi:hypothetical protein
MYKGVSKPADSVRRLVGWFLELPFRNLPSEYGDTVPPKLEALEDEMVERRGGLQGKVPSAVRVRSGRTAPKGHLTE